jgi:hypothetical protein
MLLKISTMMMTLMRTTSKNRWKKILWELKNTNSRLTTSKNSRKYKKNVPNSLTSNRIIPNKKMMTVSTMTISWTI